MGAHAEIDRRKRPRPAERREAPAVTLEIDPDPRRMRQSLNQVQSAMRGLEAEPARRVRLLVAEIVARSIEHHRPSGSICVEINVARSHVRLEVWGPALVTPRETGEGTRRSEALFPHWVLEGLADRWGLDRRSREPAMWFEIRRS